MASTSQMGAQPRNLDYYLQRMSGYSKNTIRIQPQSKPNYFAGDTCIFRLPTNSILDLHTLTLKFSGQLQNVLGGGSNVTCSWPRFTQSLLRRDDLTMGGMQVGLGSLHDYGFLNYWLESHRVAFTRTEGDLAVTDLAGYPSMQTGDYTFNLAAGAVSGWRPFSISSWIGLKAGSFMRFLDTNLCPDIEIRMMFSPNTVLSTTNTAAIRYELKNLSFSVESISFGDGSYRAMVDSRMATGEPLMVPFCESLLVCLCRVSFYFTNKSFSNICVCNSDNWVGFEGSTGQSSFSQQFTIATESLNAIMGTIRPGNYDSQVLPALGGNGAGTTVATSNSSYFTPQIGAAPSGTGKGIVLPANAFYNWYHTALSLEQTVADQFMTDGQWMGTYQFNIDSKL